MPHIDEPLLQAYVDGFCSEARVAEIDRHLSSCAACVTRLDAARSAATRASQLLGALEPGPMHAPSFEDLKERAAGPPADAARVMEALEKARAATATDEPGGRARSPLKSPVLAWAATIVIAFAVGWMTRGGTGTQPGGAVLAPAELAEQSFRSPAGEAAEAELGPPAAASADADLTAANDTAAPDSSGAADERVARQAAASPERDAATASAAVAEEAPTSVPGRGGAATPSPVSPVSPVSPPAVAEALAPTRLQEVVTDSGADRVDALTAVATLGGALPIRSLDAGMWLGAPLRTLPDLGLERVELVPPGGLEDALPGRVGVRAFYRTATGEEVVLLQQYFGPERQPAAADAASGLRADAAREVAAGREAARRRTADSAAAPAVGNAPLEEAFLDALDLPTTVRDPDGRVTHTWSEGGYLLRISGVLDADAVRGLAGRVR